MNPLIGRLSMDQMMTKTLAEIYLKQGHLQEAYEIFRALSEKEPSDIEIQNRLKELSEKLSSFPLIHPSAQSAEEKIHILERWLASIRERKER
jgi:predicted Zn-dependent protease